MVAVDFETAVAKNADLVRKPLNGSVLVGTYPGATLITTLVATGGQITVPTGYESMGQIGDDGLGFSTDVNVSDVRGWGNSSFIRRDIQSEDRTCQFVAWETKRLTHELLTGLDLSATEVSTDGEWTYDVPDRRPVRYYRMLALGIDGDGANQIIMGRYYPKATVSETGDQPWSDGDDPLGYDITMSALVDSAAGFAVREFMFGPGVLALAEAMGVDVAT